MSASLRTALLRRTALAIAALAVNTAALGAAVFNPSPGADAVAGNTLRAAILAANGNGEPDTINLLPGVYQISLPNLAGQENAAQTGDLDINADTVSIVGSGAGVSIIRVIGSVDRAFQVGGGETLELHGLSVEDGTAHDFGSGGVGPAEQTAAGGAIFCQLCNVVLDDVRIVGCSAIGGDGGTPEPDGTGADGFDAQGGGVYVGGIPVSLTLDGTVSFLDNLAQGGDGGDGGSDPQTGDGMPGGRGGGATGGALKLDDVMNVLGSVEFDTNSALGGDGGTGGSGAQQGDPGGVGGDGGGVLGGALSAHQATFPQQVDFVSNLAAAGNGGTPGIAPDGLSGAGGGNGGRANGGAGVFGPGPLDITQGTITSNRAVGGDGADGASGGTSGGLGGRGGNAFGGGLSSTGAMRLVRSVVSLNSATSGASGDGGAAADGTAGDGGFGAGAAGGGLNAAEVHLVTTVVRQNTVTASGGGAGGGGTTPGQGGFAGSASGGGVATTSGDLLDCEISENHAIGGAGGGAGDAGGAAGIAGRMGGGGLGGGASCGNGDLTVVNSTFSANGATGGPGGPGGAGGDGVPGGPGGNGGGGVGGNLGLNGGVVTLDSSTFNLGTAVGGAGGPGGGGGGTVGTPGVPRGGNLGTNLPIANAGNLNSTVVANGAGGADPDIDTTYNGCRSLIEDLGADGGQVLGCDVTYFGVDPQLAPLANNGGPTRTHAFPATSLLHDTGANPDALVYDQRGAPYPRVVNGTADIGAFELAGAALAAVSVTVAPANVPEQGPGVLTFTFTRTDSQSAPLAQPLTICYAIGGGATIGVDYTGPTVGAPCAPGQGTVTFAATQAAVAVVVTPINDALAEGPESVTFTVLDGVGYAAAPPAAAAGVIVDDEAAGVAIPTLGEWGLLGLAAALAGLGSRRLRRRRT